MVNSVVQFFGHERPVNFPPPDEEVLPPPQPRLDRNSNRGRFPVPALVPDNRGDLRVLTPIRVRAPIQSDQSSSQAMPTSIPSCPSAHKC